MKSLHILCFDTFILLSCALLSTLVPALTPPMVWFSVGLCILSIVVMGIELAHSRKRGRLSTSAIIGLVTMVAIIAMLSWWIAPRYSTYYDPPSDPSYPPAISG
jgi:hypothetical protein